MSKYIVKLQPLNTFFFGQTDKYKKKKGKEEYVADYFQRSAYFPQQTALLGTLRYYLLQKNGQIPIKDTNKALQLIGSKSFDVSVQNPNFGLINKISPVFIEHTDKNGQENYLFSNPKDLLDEKTYLKKSRLSVKSTINALPYFENYKEKTGLNNFLCNTDNKKYALNFDETKAPEGIFVEQEKIGIKKSKSGETNEEGYYKQIVYKLNTGNSFAFLADINDETLDKNPSYVSLGADKSPFKISFEPLSDNNTDIELQISTKLNFSLSEKLKIVLLSDTYISELKQNDYDFAISNTITFRFLHTEVKKGTRYYSSDPLKKNRNLISHSDKFNLFERGSVFFFNNEKQLDDFALKLKAETNFRQIGYNYFKTIK